MGLKLIIFARQRYLCTTEIAKIEKYKFIKDLQHKVGKYKVNLKLYFDLFVFCTNLEYFITLKLYILVKLYY